jgi:hypothetical protein
MEGGRFRQGWREATPAGLGLDGFCGLTTLAASGRENPSCGERSASAVGRFLAATGFPVSSRARNTRESVLCVALPVPAEKFSQWAKRKRSRLLPRGPAQKELPPASKECPPGRSLRRCDWLTPAKAVHRWCDALDMMRARPHVQGVVASYAEFISNPSSIKGMADDVL